VKSEGIDIVLVLDISGSMRAEDMKPDNRLTVAKQVAKKFVEGRVGDRIGLVVFSGGAYTQCPLTLDHGIVLSLIDQVGFGQVSDGTASAWFYHRNRSRGREEQGRDSPPTVRQRGRSTLPPRKRRSHERPRLPIGAGGDGRPVPRMSAFGRRYVTITPK
jgi:hypothetical protein